MATSAERQRRSRAHHKGDHSLCDSSRGCDVTAEPVAPATRAPKLGTRGRRLWRDLDADNLPPAQRTVAEEACRLADRLDKLDDILRGDETVWMRFHSLNEDGSIVKVVLNTALAEARQQQVALKQLVAELRQSKAETPKQEASLEDELAAARRRRAAGM